MVRPHSVWVSNRTICISKIKVVGTLYLGVGDKKEKNAIRVGECREETSSYYLEAPLCLLCQIKWGITDVLGQRGRILFIGGVLERTPSIYLCAHIIVEVAILYGC